MLRLLSWTCPAVLFCSHQVFCVGWWSVKSAKKPVLHWHLWGKYRNQIVSWLKPDTAISTSRSSAGLHADILPYQFKTWYNFSSIEHSWLSICWCSHLFVSNGASSFLYITVQWLDWIPISNLNAHTNSRLYLPVGTTKTFRNTFWTLELTLTRLVDCYKISVHLIYVKNTTVANRSWRLLPWYPICSGISHIVKKAVGVCLGRMLKRYLTSMKINGHISACFFFLQLCDGGSRWQIKMPILSGGACISGESQAAQM